MKALADLHTHSKFSDGKLTPTELVGLAGEFNLAGLALTDHDTLDGLEEFMSCENPKEIVRLSGVEISTELGEFEIHLLGYFVDPKSKSLQDALEFLRDARIRRFPKMLEKLEGLSIHIPDESVEEILKGVESPARPHLARLLVQYEHAADVNDAFKKYVGKGKPAYVKKERLDTIETIEILKSIGAVPVMAHPLVTEQPNLRNILQQLRNKGLEGVEVEYDYTHLGMNVNTDRIRQYASELDLVCTGGSDYHGDDERIQLGCVAVPISVIDEIEERRNN